MRTIAEDLGLVVLVIGVSMVFLPAGVIAAGLALVLAANTHDGFRAARGTQAAADVEEPLTGPDGASGASDAWAGA